MGAILDSSKGARKRKAGSSCEIHKIEALMETSEHKKEHPNLKQDEEIQESKIWKSEEEILKWKRKKKENRFLKGHTPSH